MRVLRFRKEFAAYAADSISYALGLTDSVNEPQDHGFDPRRSDSDDSDAEEPGNAEESGPVSEKAPAAQRDMIVVPEKGHVAAVQGAAGADGASDDLTSLRRAAERGDAKAQSALGDRFLYGDGVARDFNEAREWYQKAAEQGDAKADNSLGYMYDAGRGVRRDYAEALMWYSKAADHGSAAAACSLGNMYYSGQGVRQSYGEAWRWYKKAADFGSASAAGNIRYMRETGLVP